MKQSVPTHGAREGDDVTSPSRELCGTNLGLWRAYAAELIEGGLQRETRAGGGAAIAVCEVSSRADAYRHLWPKLSSSPLT